MRESTVIPSNQDQIWLIKIVGYSMPGMVFGPWWVLIYIFYVFISHFIYCLRTPLIVSVVVAQIRGRTVGSCPLLHRGSWSPFLSREVCSAFFPRRLASYCAGPRIREMISTWPSLDEMDEKIIFFFYSKI